MQPTLSPVLHQPGYMDNIETNKYMKLGDRGGGHKRRWRSKMGWISSKDIVNTEKKISKNKLKTYIFKAVLYPNRIWSSLCPLTWGTLDNLSVCFFIHRLMNEHIHSVQTAPGGEADSCGADLSATTHLTLSNRKALFRARSPLSHLCKIIVATIMCSLFS